jgi:citrate synthase
MDGGSEGVIAAETVLSASDGERGTSRDAFIPVFAIARCAGWLAPAMEQQKTGHLIRPISAYTRPVPPGAGVR